MLRHYILGERFILMNDHGGLKYLFDQPKLNVRQVVAIKFDFEIKYIKGKENRVVDALNKRVKLCHVAAISSYGTDLEEIYKNVG